MRRRGARIYRFPDGRRVSLRNAKRRPIVLSGPTEKQRAWLSRGLAQPGGKLPLFDEEGQRYPQRTIRTCIDQGWAEPWFNNPLKPDWLVCRLTESGRGALDGSVASAAGPKEAQCKPKTQ